MDDPPTRSRPCASSAGPGPEYALSPVSIQYAFGVDLPIPRRAKRLLEIHMNGLYAVMSGGGGGLSLLHCPEGRETRVLRRSLTCSAWPSGSRVVHEWFDPMVRTPPLDIARSHRPKCSSRNSRSSDSSDARRSPRVWTALFNADLLQRELCASERQFRPVRSGFRRWRVDEDDDAETGPAKRVSA
jgi:hypothetical protein